MLAYLTLLTLQAIAPPARPSPTQLEEVEVVGRRGAARVAPEQELGAEGIDRITLYRTLRTFEQQGVIHRVIDATDIIRYAACATGCTEHAHHDNHVHFKCTACQHTYCLNQVSIPPVVLPGRFQAERSDYLMSGVCSQCRPAA